MRKVAVLNWSLDTVLIPLLGATSLCSMKEYCGEEGIDLLVFMGGIDVHPTMYKQQDVIRGQYDIGRDLREARSYQAALKKKIPMVGICRGSQFLCVMNGGKLYQHVEGHLGDHSITTASGEKFTVTSTHHQMMYPHGGELIAWCKNKSNVYTSDGLKRPGVDHEMVYWKDTKCLSVQYHPEYMATTARGFSFVQEQVERLFKEQ
jgi:gamma-glutamyl-gamma-aminobutyrate hydrolase PuuD